MQGKVTRHVHKSHFWKRKLSRSKGVEPASFRLPAERLNHQAKPAHGTGYSSLPRDRRQVSLGWHRDVTEGLLQACHLVGRLFQSGEAIEGRLCYLLFTGRGAGQAPEAGS